MEGQEDNVLYQLMNAAPDTRREILSFVMQDHLCPTFQVVHSFEIKNIGDKKVASFNRYNEIENLTSVPSCKLAHHCRVVKVDLVIEIGKNRIVINILFIESCSEHDSSMLEYIDREIDYIQKYQFSYSKITKITAVDTDIIIDTFNEPANESHRIHVGDNQKAQNIIEKLIKMTIRCLVEFQLMFDRLARVLPNDTKEIQYK